MTRLLTYDKKLLIKKDSYILINVTLIDILCSVEFHSVIKIKVHNVFYTHTFIYSELILSTDGFKYILQFP